MRVTAIRTSLIGATQVLAIGLTWAEPGADLAMPDLPNAHVTIPYSELRALWEAARDREEEAKRRPAEPPVSHWWSKIEGTLTLGADGKSGALEMVFEGESTGNGWQELPLLDGDLRVEQCETAEQPLIFRDGYRLLVKGAGKVRAVVKGSTDGWLRLTDDASLKLQLPAAAVKRLTVRGVPKGHGVRWTGDEATHVASADGEIYQLQSREGKMELSVPVKPAAAVLGPSVWKLDTRLLVRPDEGRMRYSADLAAHTDGGAANEMWLEMPASASGVEVQGDDSVTPEVLPLPDGRKQLRLKWKTAGIMDRELGLSYALPLSPLAEEWTLQAPVIAGSADSRVLYAVVPAEGMELEGAALRAIPAQRLGSKLRAAVGDARFVTAEAGPSLVVKPRWLPTVATAEAVVSAAKAQLQLVDDGSMQTSVSWLVAHQGAMPWRVEMPESVDVLSCVVAGRAVKPVRRDGREWELALPPAAGGAKGGTEVTIRYVGKTEALDPVSGRVALELPRTALFIERIDWVVAIPPRFEVTAVEGNLSVTGGGSDGAEATAVGLRKDLCRGEKPGATFFYQRKDFNR